MAFKLPTSVYSPALIDGVVFEIRTYIEWYRQAEVQKKVGAQPSTEPTISAETAQTIGVWSEGKPTTLESLERLVEYIGQMNNKVAHVTLAALPNHAQREVIVNWFREKTSPDVLVSFVADRNLGGGILVRTPNRVHDMSWRQGLLSGRDKLAEIVKNV